MARKKADNNTKRSLEAVGFYSDYQKDKKLFAALVRSPAATGKIKSITADLPEGYFLFTADDIPGDKSIQINKVSTKIFGYGNISYTGEPLGIIVGPDMRTVKECLDKVSINLDVASLESALNKVIKDQDSTEELSELVEQISDMPSLDTVVDNSHVEAETNKEVAIRQIKTGLYKDKTPAEVEKMLLETEGITLTAETWENKITVPKWQETAGAFCYMEAGRMHIYAPSKWSSFLHKSASKVLGIEQTSVVVHKTKTGQIAPNGIWRTTQIALQTAVASYLAKAPVKLIFSQKEQEKFMAAGTKTLLNYKTFTNPDGLIEALQVDIDIDIGVSNPFAQEITDRIALASFSYYRPKNMFINSHAHTSKNPPTSIMIHGIDSQAFFAIENHLHKICDSSERLYPDEIRNLNSKISKKDSFPFTIPVTDQIETVVQESIKRSDFNRKYASFQMDAIDRVEKNSKPFFALPLRGIGFANGYNPSGYFGNSTFSYDSKIEITLTTDDKVIIHSIKPSEVIQEIWKNTAAEILQIPKQNILIDSEFELSEIPENPMDTYSTIGIGQELVKKCCTEIQKKRFHQPLPISAKKSLSPAAKKGWEKDSFTGIPFYTAAFATTVVEVDLDPYTYGERIKGIWITVDCGEVFDEAAAIKTIRLEIQQELSMLVQGKTISCDNISINFIKSKNRTGQIGGLVHNTLPAAFASALSLALTTQLTKLPCTEMQLFNLIRNRVKPQAETQPAESESDAVAAEQNQSEETQELSEE